MSMIAVVGDRNPAYKVHQYTEAGLSHVRDGLPFAWISTEDLAHGVVDLERFSGFFIAPGTPYKNADGALTAIRFAREHGIPTIGTCGGFQHMVLEFVRNVLGDTEADHAENNPGATRFAVTPLVCSLAGQNRPVKVLEGTKAREIYGAETVVEPFFCNYGLNTEYLPDIEAKGLRVSGLGEDGTIRIMELKGHPFFLATLYVPQARSTAVEPHPLVTAFVAAARRRSAIVP